MPRLNRTTGAMQQDEAAMAPRMPPRAVSLNVLVPPVSIRAGRLVFDREFRVTVSHVHGRFLQESLDARVRSRYGVKGREFTKMRPLTIAALAKASGVHLETVRYYERIGLMPKPARTASGYRTTMRSTSAGFPSFAGLGRWDFRAARSRNCSLSPFGTRASVSRPR